MNFYHFRPSCKVIKRSRNSEYLLTSSKIQIIQITHYSHFQGKGPFFTQFSDEIVAEIVKYPETNLRNGEVVLSNFGFENSYSRKVFVGGLPLDVTEREYRTFLSIKNDLKVVVYVF